MNKELRIALSAIIAGISAIIAMLCILGFANAKPAGNKTLLGIMYHQVLKDESRHGKYVVSPYELEADLKYLSENGYVSLLPSEVLDIVQQKKSLPEKAVVLSFDDGYETGIGYVLPLLKQYNMKAVINIVGEYTDQYSALSENEKNLSYAYLTWDEINELTKSGYVEIGNHTYNMHGNDYKRHGCGKNYNESDSEYQAILYSDSEQLQQKIEQLTGVRPVTFAYPYGIISDGSVKTIQSTGIGVFLTCAEKPTVINYELPIMINRYNREHDRPAEQICSEYSQACSELL